MLKDFLVQCSIAAIAKFRALMKGVPVNWASSKIFAATLLPEPCNSRDASGGVVVKQCNVFWSANFMWFSCIRGESVLLAFAPLFCGILIVTPQMPRENSSPGKRFKPSGWDSEKAATER